MKQNVFWPLVRHEFLCTGNRRKAKKRRFSKGWKFFYIFVIVVLSFGLLTYASFQEGFYLANIWFFTLGLPYMIFFSGFGSIKKEWDNGTYGWWLTLPYSRNQLIISKFLAAWAQALMIIAAVYVAATLFTLFMTVIESQYTLHDTASFMIVGLNWFVIMIGISPFVLALGMFLTTAHYTVLQPLTPVFWVLFMGTGSFAYWGIGFSFDKENNLFAQFGGEGQVNLFPYSLRLTIMMIFGWILTYVILRLIAYLLDKKLAL